MALSSFFKRKKSEDAAGPEAAASLKPAKRSAAPGAGGLGSASNLPHESAAVVQARTQARRRLIGAAVLLLLGVLLFPLVFETKPRPLPMDLPISVAPTGPAGKGAPATTPVTPVRPAPAMITETAEPEPARAPATAASSPLVTAAPAPVPTPAPDVKASAPAVAAAPQVKASAPAATAAKSAAPAPQAKASAPAAAAAAKAAAPAPQAKASVPALAAPAPAPDPAAGRFVVQVGAFADDATVRQTRQKVEKLGLKTYTQEVNTEAGKRVRVRVGPFATKEEAAQVLGKLKGAGLPGAVLTL
jgi:DedD protein